MPFGRPWALLVPLLAVALLGGASSTAAAASPQVTVISDSVLTSILWYQQNLDTLSQGFDVDMQVAIGRRLAGVSIPFEGVPSPTVVDLIPTIEIRPTVVVEMGYNDDPAAFEGEADQVIDLLLARGAQHIVWPTLSEATSAYASMNRDLVSLLIAHPQLTLADWNRYSASHPDWFQTDHIHLLPAGGGGMATLLHAALESSPANDTTLALPQAHRGRSYSTLLQAPPGAAGAVSWRLAAGSLAPGLRLLASGVVDGAPSATGAFSADAIVETADDVLAHVRLTLDVRPAARATKRLPA